MLRLIKRLALWWTRRGEDKFLSRTLTLAGLAVTLLALGLRKWTLQTQAVWADRASLWLALLVGVVTALAVLRSVWLLRFWPWNKVHPAGSLAAQHLLNVPEEPDYESPYRFHVASSVHELEAYVTESEYFLAEANPQLDTDGRRELYKRWLGLSPNSFVYLCRTDRAGPVALSIILPLTRTGYERLLGLSRPKKEVIHFGEEEIARRGPYRHLLIDTFIITKRPEKRLPGASGGQKRYGRSLILRHLAFFWKDQAQQGKGRGGLRKTPRPHPLAILAETNKDKLFADLNSIGFKQEGTSAIGCPLFAFHYPAAVPNAEREMLVSQLIDRIWAMKTWKIEMNRRPGR